MNYELAKKLKDAGFPQKVSIGSFVWDYGLDAWQLARDQEEVVLDTVLVCPTLSELIEACGEDFLTLRWHYKRGDSGEREWKAKPTYPYNNPGIYIGPTPEEAVAKLWLALHSTKCKREAQQKAAPPPSDTASKDIPNSVK